MRDVAHHIHRRKRLEPYPHPVFWMRLLDNVVMYAGICGILMGVPQVIEIYVSKQAAGVSVVSWFGWAALDIPFILYAIVHKARPLVITYSGWLILNTVVAVGAVIYG